MQFRRGRLQILGVARSRKDEIHLRERRHRGANGLSLVGDVGRQFGQQAEDLLLLGQAQLAQGIVQIDDVQRLDKERDAAAGAIVHDALHASLAIRAHGDDKAPLAPGDERLLEIGRDLRRRKHPL